ncbi:MAG: hypothetical protein KDA21_15220, partial [Phycisphaerales bacterium]|nr:hypothetical protein [Phycisphaerales bacterium]
MHRTRTHQRGTDVFQGRLWPDPDAGAPSPVARPRPAPLEGHVALCVLASSSQGNCSVLIHRRAPDLYRLTLIDAGLSPRRTRLVLSHL